MTELPTSLMAVLPDDARPAIERWWAGLAPADRDEVASAWDERREVRFFTPQGDDAGRPDEWRRVPRVIGGRFIPHDDSVRMHEWLADWTEYVDGHEDVVLLPRVVVLFRTYHFCQVEPAAQAVIASGVLPAEFICPAATEDCPMRRVQAAAPNQTLHLTPAAAGGWWVVAPWNRR